MRQGYPDQQLESLARAHREGPGAATGRPGRSAVVARGPWQPGRDGSHGKLFPDLPLATDAACFCSLTQLSSHLIGLLNLTVHSS